MTEHLPPSFTFLAACLLALLAYTLPDPTPGSELQLYVEVLTLLAKAVAPAGTIATALFAYYRWRTERRDKQADKRRIANLEQEARELVAERARFRAEIRQLASAPEEGQQQRLAELEAELATLREIVQTLRK